MTNFTCTCTVLLSTSSKEHTQIAIPRSIMIPGRTNLVVVLVLGWANSEEGVGQIQHDRPLYVLLAGNVK